MHSCHFYGPPYLSSCSNPLSISATHLHPLHYRHLLMPAFASVRGFVLEAHVGMRAPLQPATASRVRPSAPQRMNC